MKQPTPRLQLLAALLPLALAMAAVPALSAQDQVPGDRQVPGGEAPLPRVVPPGEPGAEEAPADSASAAQPSTAATILGEVAAELGLVGSISRQTAEELAAQHQAQTQGEVLPASVVAPRPLPLQYAFVGMAEGQFETTHEQTLSASLHEFQTGEEAWGYWSRVRQGDVVQVAQEARYDGQKLRFWQGPFCGELSFAPPNPTGDQRGLTAVAQALAARIGVHGNRPALIGALPTRALVEDSIIYFHSGGTASDDLLSLSDEAEGLAATYQVDGNRETLLLVRYPSVQDAQAAWRGFVANHLGEQVGAETGGLRFIRLAGEGWSGVASRGQACAFVIGAITRDELRLMLIQAIGRI